MRPKINMRSAAQSVKGQGVGGAYEEQVGMVKKFLKQKFKISENKKGKFDIVHYHTVNPNYFVENLLTDKHKTVSVCHVHFLPDTVDDSLNLPKFARKIFYKYVLAFYNSMDWLVAVNPGTLQKIREYNIIKPKLKYIPNFVSTERFFPVHADEKIKIRQKYGINEDKFVVLGVGQLQTRKGIVDFVKAARKLPDIQFFWAGGFSFGKITDGYAEIKKITDNPPKNLIFSGIVERSEMNDIYNMADMFFLPSFDELFPMSVLEAQAVGLPVLLRDIAVYKNILEDSYEKAQNATGFIEKIRNISNDKQLYNCLAEKSKKCHNVYSEEKIAKEWDKFYTKIVKGAHGRRKKE